MKVKKTDLPVLPQDTDILPSLDDTEADTSDIEEDEDDNDDDDEDMMADEAVDTDDDDYESDEDTDADRDADASAVSDLQSDSWDSLSTQQTLNNKPSASIKEVPASSSSSSASGTASTTSTTTTATPSTTEKLTDAQTSPVTAIPTPDPYFTHFDPRLEHQSFKVVKKLSRFY